MVLKTNVVVALNTVVAVVNGRWQETQLLRLKMVVIGSYALGWVHSRPVWLMGRAVQAESGVNITFVCVLWCVLWCVP